MGYNWFNKNGGIILMKMNNKEIFTQISWLIGIVGVYFLLMTFVASPIKVSGESMMPTLLDNERMIQLKFGEVERFDIVTFPSPVEPNKTYIKRVIGLPGDQIVFDKDELYINGELVKEVYLETIKKNYSVDEPYTMYTKSMGESSGANLSTFSLETITGIKKKTIPEGKLFVLGDNRRNSTDSRVIGLINVDDIIGRVKFAYYPLTKIGLSN